MMQLIYEPLIDQGWFIGHHHGHSVYYDIFKNYII